MHSILHCIHNKIILTLFCCEIFTVNMEHSSRGFKILQLSYDKTDCNTENLAEYRRLNKKHSHCLNSDKRSTVGIQNSLLYSDRQIPRQIVADNHLKSGEH